MVAASRPLLLRLATPALVGLGLLVALASGFAAQGESLHALVFTAVAGGLGLVALAIVHPRLFHALLLPNVVLLPVIPALAGKGLNTIDVLLPIALATTWVLVPRDHVLPAAPAEAAARHRSLVRATIAYYAVALLSLALLAGRGLVAPAIDSLGVLVRSMQAATFFYLVCRQVEHPDGVGFVRNAILGGLAAAAVVNLPAVAFLGLARAGSVLVLGEAAEPGSNSLVAGLPLYIGKPNELGSACVLVWALLLALPPRRWILAAGLVLSFVLLLATQSRSGLLSWATLVIVYGLRRGHRRLLLLPLLGVALVAVLPEPLKVRLLRTVFVETGTVEAYSSFVRIFGWETALEVFRAYPLFGVGYLGFRFVAHDFNSLGLYFHTVENFFLEIAVSMGVAGIVVLAWFAIACVRLGRCATKGSEPGSVAYRMGAITPAFLLSVAVGNLTGDNLVGLVNIAQLAIFLALLSRAALLPSFRRAVPEPR